jgi:hypothetical protein
VGFGQVSLAVLPVGVSSHLHGLAELGAGSGPLVLARAGPGPCGTWENAVMDEGKKEIRRQATGKAVE